MTTEPIEQKRPVRKYLEMITGPLDQKRSYRQYKARTARLPADYRAAIEALERYLTYYGAIIKGDILVSMLEDLADLFEQSAASGTPIRQIVGADPVEFAETFIRNYSDGQWIDKERQRLVSAIDQAAGESPDENEEGVIR